MQQSLSPAKLKSKSRGHQEMSNSPAIKKDLVGQEAWQYLKCDSILTEIKPSKKRNELDKLFFTFSLLRATIESSKDIKAIADSNVQLLMYGSAVNGLAMTQDSDLDLTLIILSGQHKDHIQLLQGIQRLLMDKLGLNGKILQTSRVDILEFRLNGIDVDLSINAVLEVYNSKLIHTYAKLDQRFIDVALLFKFWNKKHFSDRRKRLNSYSITLLIIAFMQFSCILPNLQTLNKQQTKILKVYNKSTNQEIMTDVYFQDNIDYIKQSMEKSHRQSTHTWSATDIFTQLLKYYTKDFGIYNKIISISSLDGPFQAYDDQKHLQLRTNHPFKIQDPFDSTYNPSKITWDIFKEYKKRINKTYQQLTKDQTLLIPMDDDTSFVVID